jgi:hypothetical protein
MLVEGGDRVDIENTVDWKSPNSLLKASFPFAASNPKATYDLGLARFNAAITHLIITKCQRKSGLM